MTTKHSFNSKDYITARSLSGLRRKMLELNLKNNCQYFFGEPSQYTTPKGNKEFMVWYERSFSEEEIQSLLVTNHKRK